MLAMMDGADPLDTDSFESLELLRRTDGIRTLFFSPLDNNNSNSNSKNNKNENKNKNYCEDRDLIQKDFQT